MSEVSARYTAEVAAGWENSALDARPYPGDGRPPAPDARLTPLVEAVYHAASAGDVDAAAAIFYNRLYQGPRAGLTATLGRYEVALELLRQFYPRNDLTLDPRTSDPRSRRWLLHETAVCLHALGQLDQATALAGRAATAALAMSDPHNAALSYHSLAETYLASGALASCRAAADAALALAEQSGDREDALMAYTTIGHLSDLTDEPEPAAAAYAQALRIAEEDTSVPLLFSLSGVRYAAHLLAGGEADEALRVNRANLDFCREQGWTSDVAQILGLLTVIGGDEDEAQRTSDESVDLARAAGNRQVLAEVLLDRAGFANARRRAVVARVAADEAMAIAQANGLRRAEVDARTQLALAYAGEGGATNGRAEAHLARELAAELGYRRGHRVAEEVLARF